MKKHPFQVVKELIGYAFINVYGFVRICRLELVEHG